MSKRLKKFDLLADDEWRYEGRKKSKTRGKKNRRLTRGVRESFLEESDSWAA